MGKLFGTDGIRGVANEYPMTPEMALNIGRAVATLFKRDGIRSKIVVGKDTRVSSYMLEYAIVSGICSAGTDVYLTGVLPTPAVAFMTSSTDADAGIVISASHNPFYDNGIKFFKNDAYKLSDEKEAELEQLILDPNIASTCKSARKTGTVIKIKDAGIRYTDFLRKAVPKKWSLKGMKIILDCSNGATYKVAPEIFAYLGAEIELMFVSPDGRNINEECGSQHPEIMAGMITERDADIGLAFDGDGDRLTAVDETGNIVSGDQILAICAKNMKHKGLLKNNTVVCTVMSNQGFKVAMKEMDIKYIESDVGDRSVMKQMISSGAVLGGEDSGHMIFSDHHTTGDGILTALKLVEAMKDESKPLSQLSDIMKKYPQELINVDVTDKPDIQTVPEIAEKIRFVEAELGEKGRVLVRYSGTQPVCRVMVEGPGYDETKLYCRQIADTVREKLGKKE
ncbi:MAG: phosphoglucosamine mutase [Desulfobacteraceae bacterium]|nr:phosphoglucosamine mutase [Desulfobacteraceae bacterium]